MHITFLSPRRERQVWSGAGESGWQRVKVCAHNICSAPRAGKAPSSSSWHSPRPAAAAAVAAGRAYFQMGHRSRDHL